MTRRSATSGAATGPTSPARPARPSRWIRPTGSDTGATFDVVVTNASGTATSASATLTVHVGPSVTTPPANLTVTAPAAAAFSVVAAGDTPLTYQWRRNGTNIPGATSASYTLTPTKGSDSGATFDVVVTNAYGSASSALATLTVHVAPSITTSPTNKTVTAPGPVTFAVVAAGDAPLSYQWRRNGADIPGATSTSFTLNPTDVTDTGAKFDVVVTNAYGSATSALANLTVNPEPVPPSITTDPASLAVAAPAPAAFSVVADGDEPLTYQWRRNGIDIPGATTDFYTLDPSAGSDTGATFDVVVTNAYGSATSAAAILTVHLAPSVTTPPADVTVTAPAPATFSVVSAGDAPLSYQWRRNGADIPGATNASYSLDPTAGADSGATFDVVVTNAYGSATSAPATLTVHLAPSVTTPPAGVTVTAPAPATFSVVAAGDRDAQLSVASQRHRHSRCHQRVVHARSDRRHRRRRDVRRRRHQRLRHRDQCARDPDGSPGAERHRAAGRRDRDGARAGDVLGRRQR